MWYILYEMLSEHRRIGETWRGFLIQGLSRRIWDETSAVIKLTVFCSQEFVAMLCINNVFVRFLVSILRVCTVIPSSHRHLGPLQFHGVAKNLYIPADCLSSIVEFCEQSNLNSLTRTQLHKYTDTDYTTGCKIFVNSIIASFFFY